jgi:FkbM family methyltransferase
MSRIKLIVKNILCNDVTGALLTWIFGNSIPDIRWKGFRFLLPQKGVSQTNRAAIFWGFYESAEIRFIRQYLSGIRNVIELGGSLGIVSAHIVSRLERGARIICVEANPYLIANISENIRRYAAAGVSYTVVNSAVQYNVPEVAMNISADNTESSVRRNVGKESEVVMVRATTLEELVRIEQLDHFTLVCDIEGSEIEMILLDKKSLAMCTELFIELHDAEFNGVQYAPDEILKMLVNDCHFRLISKHGPVCYLTK